MDFNFKFFPSFHFFFLDKIQIIGMTATIGNLEEVGKFLKAECYVGNFRPVSLNEYIKCDRKIYSIDWNSENGVKECRKLPLSAEGVYKLVKTCLFTHTGS